MPSYNDYHPIISLLRMAKESGECSEYIRMTVEDALVVKRTPESIRNIHRETYRYAVKLGRSKSNLLDEIKVEHIQQSDIVKLIDFFEQL